MADVLNSGEEVGFWRDGRPAGQDLAQRGQSCTAISIPSDRANACWEIDSEIDGPGFLVYERNHGTRRRGMRSYRVEMEIALGERAAASVMKLARAHTRQPVHSIEQALVELAESNPLLKQARARLESSACRLCDTAARPTRETLSAVEGERTDRFPAADLDGYETGLYLCRWPNGDFSVVKADSRRDAILELDEWDGAHPGWLVPLNACMIDFRINERGEIELGQLGHDTAEFVWKTCYPFLDAVLSSADVLAHRAGEATLTAAEKIRRAVAHERERLQRRGSEGQQAQTEIGRFLQRMLGTVGPVADRYVDEAAKRLLRSADRRKGKPN